MLDAREMVFLIVKKTIQRFNDKEIVRKSRAAALWSFFARSYR